MTVLSPQLQQLVAAQQARAGMTPTQGMTIQPPQPEGLGSSAQQLATTFSPGYFDSLRSAIGSAPTVQAPPSTASAFAAFKPTPINNLPDDYYNNQRQVLMNQLNDQFFGPTGTMHQVASNESAGGRLGSGVGNLNISEGVLKPYSLAAQQGDLGIMNAQIQERQANQQFNADQSQKYAATMSQMIAADSANELTASQANASLQAQYTDLLSRLADAEAGRMTQEQIAQLDADVRMYEAASKERAMEAQTAVDKANAQINFMNSLGQFKPANGSTAQGSANTLSSYFGIPVPPPSATSPVSGTPPNYSGQDQQLSPDGKWRWSALNNQWMPTSLSGYQDLLNSGQYPQY